MGTFDELDATSHARPLSRREAYRLERALARRAGAKGVYLRWTRADKVRLRAHLLRGRKPKQIALLMHRPERTIWRMMDRLGWTVRDAQVWVIDPSEGI
jgi:hypothetical protein